MKNTLTFFLALFMVQTVFSQAIIINHSSAKLDPIPESAIQNAKQTLHIAYGHTSHGSQLTDGMTGLIDKTDLLGYKGDIYEWNEGGTEGALDIDDYFVDGDLGHLGNTDWAVGTRTYLDNPENSDVNVIIWSWCGGCSDNTYEGIQTYLDTLNHLEIDYPNVKFVYMTGHTDIWADATLKANNQHIRTYCIANNKILYDFEDIEHYDPDGNYFEFATDDCNYYSDATGPILLGNWATDWQGSHTEGIDWYTCTAAHTQSLNGNLKAYAAWHLWCRLSGWEGTQTNIENISLDTKLIIFPNPANTDVSIKFSTLLPSNITIEIVDIAGKQCTSIQKNYSIPGGHQINLNIGDLPKGLYLCKYSDGIKTFSKTFVRN